MPTYCEDFGLYGDIKPIGVLLDPTTMTNTPQISFKGPRMGFKAVEPLPCRKTQERGAANEIFDQFGAVHDGRAIHWHRLGVLNRHKTLAPPGCSSPLLEEVLKGNRQFFWGLVRFWAVAVTGLLLALALFSKTQVPGLAAQRLFN